LQLEKFFNSKKKNFFYLKRGGLRFYYIEKTSATPLASRPRANGWASNWGGEHVEREQKGRRAKGSASKRVGEQVDREQVGASKWVASKWVRPNT
jgi:hypothetical protein